MPSKAARAAQRAAVAAAEQRAARATKLALRLAWDALPAMLTEEFLAAVERGETGGAKIALKRPSTSAVMPAVKAAQRAGWKAGIAEGKRALADIFGERFDDPSGGARAAVLARRRQIEREYRATGPEMKQARAQAKEFLRSFMRGVRDQVGDDLQRARGRRDPERAFKDSRDMLETIKSGGELSTEARRFVRGVEGRADRVLATPLLEVDWGAARRGEVTAWQAQDQIVLVEFAAAMDDETTPACQFLDGATLLSTDKRVVSSSPGLHFRCRSMFIARAGTRDEADWDKQTTKTIGEPSAGAERQRSYTLRPSQIKIPAGAPNVPPPSSLAEWV